MSLTAFHTNNYSTQIKRDKSYVTSVDTQIEAALVNKLNQTYPDHNLHGEESGSINRYSDYTWYLDPLDGTSNFIYGLPIFGAMAAVTYRDQPIAAAIYLPALNFVLTASKGNGVKINRQPLLLAFPNSINQLTLILDCGKSSVARSTTTTYLAKYATKFRSLRWLGCVAGHTAIIASGQSAASFIVNAPPHDLIPIALILSEAGLSITDSTGSPWTIASDILLSFPPTIKKQVMNTLPIE